MHRIYNYLVITEELYSQCRCEIGRKSCQIAFSLFIVNCEKYKKETVIKAKQMPVSFE